MAILQDLIVSVRNLRAELKVEPKVKVPIEVYAHEPEVARPDRSKIAARSSGSGVSRPIDLRRASLAEDSERAEHRAV